MKKILKYLIIGFFIVIMLYELFMFFFVSLYFQSSGETGKIENYKFELSDMALWRYYYKIDKESKMISIHDSIKFTQWGSYDGMHYYKDNLTIIKIKDGKTFKETVYILSYPGEINISDKKKLNGGFFLIYINGKTNDDFGWFSWEKHKKVKLFEETIIEPLSDKYERIE